MFFEDSDVPNRHMEAARAGSGAGSELVDGVVHRHPVQMRTWGNSLSHDKGIPGGP